MKRFQHELGFAFKLSDDWEQIDNTNNEKEFIDHSIMKLYNQKTDEELYVLFDGFLANSVFDGYFESIKEDFEPNKRVVRSEKFDFQFNNQIMSVYKVLSIDEKRNKWRLDYFFKLSLKNNAIGHLVLISKEDKPQLDEFMQKVLSTWEFLN